jgi:hypothetical protein
MAGRDSRGQEISARPRSVTRTAALVAAVCSALACILLVVDISTNAYAIAEVRKSVVPCPPPPP